MKIEENQNLDKNELKTEKEKTIINLEKNNKFTQTFITINDFINIHSFKSVMSNDDFVNKFYASNSESKKNNFQNESTVLSTNPNSDNQNKKKFPSSRLIKKLDPFELFKIESIKANPNISDKDISDAWNKLDKNIKKIYSYNAEHEKKKIKSKN